MGEPIEADRERAHRMLSREARLEDVDAVAAALADERERARAPFLALANDMEDEAPDAEAWDGDERSVLLDAADRIRRAAEETGQ